MIAVRSLFHFSQRDPSRATMMARGTVLIVVVAAVVAVLTAFGRGAFEDRFAVTVVFDDIGGALIAGDDVKVNGVIVGEIKEIRSAPGSRRGAEVEVALDPRHAKQVPAAVTARILPATVFGTTFVDLVPAEGAAGGSDRAVIQAGQRIEQDTSAETLELQKILDGLDRVVTALGPAQLATALENLAGALDGNGEQLGRTIDTVATYFTRLNPRMPLVRENLDLLATNLELLQGYGDDLFDAVDDAAVAATTLVEQEGELTEVLTGGTKLFNALGRLLDENEQGLVDALFSTAVAVDTLYEGRQKLPQGLVSTFDFVKSFSTAMDEGPYLKIRSLIQLPARPTYTKADCPWYGDVPGRGCTNGAR